MGPHDFRTPNIDRGPLFTIFVDGEPLPAYKGETILGALWASRRHVLRRSPVKAEPRGFLCGMGTCFECLVTLADGRSVRACMEPVTEGMKITTSDKSNATN